MSSEAVNYGSYLKIEELLALQDPRDDIEHDEMLFITIHQVYRRSAAISLVGS